MQNINCYYSKSKNLALTFGKASVQPHTLAEVVVRCGSRMPVYSLRHMHHRLRPPSSVVLLQGDGTDATRGLSGEVLVGFGIAIIMCSFFSTASPIDGRLVQISTVLAPAKIALVR